MFLVVMTALFQSSPFTRTQRNNYFYKKCACIIFAIHFQWDTKINIFVDIAFVGLGNFVSSQKIILSNKVSPRWILVDFGYVVPQKICY